MARSITAKVVPNLLAVDLAAKATTLAAQAGIASAAITPGLLYQGRVDTGIRHIFVTTTAVATAVIAKTHLDAAIAAAGGLILQVTGSAPQLESNDADDAVTISAAAGATTIRFTAIDIDQNPDNSLIFIFDSLNVIPASAAVPVVTVVSDGVWDVAIDILTNTGPYTATSTATDVQGNQAKVTTVITTAA